jgi:hypothetical protein
VKQEFSYKGFDVTVIRKSMWVRGVSTSWNRPKSRNEFHARNTTTNQRISGIGGKIKAKQKIDSLN